MTRHFGAMLWASANVFCGDPAVWIFDRSIGRRNRMSKMRKWRKKAKVKLDEFMVNSDKRCQTESTQQALNEVLVKSFPNADKIRVLDFYLGYRKRQDEFILLVETKQAGESAGHVVKIAFNAERLEKEFDAWNSCCKKRIRRDVVFMTLKRRYNDSGSQLISLVYQDARRWIGLEKTVSLEDAFVASVETDSPTVHSLANVLFQVFHRLGHHLYRYARPVPPDQLVTVPENGKLLDFRFNSDHWLSEALAEWSTTLDGADIRKRAEAAISPRERELNSDESSFLDPISYLGDVLSEIRGGKPASDYVPMMLRGNSHGDLHGRNVLVGTVKRKAQKKGHAHWPTLFDYEDMAIDNLLAWDFVKLETELKIRAYPKVFGETQDDSFPLQVWEFELKLARRTEECRRDGWPDPIGSHVRHENLLLLVLTIRQMAEVYLSEKHDIPGYWLEDYYFALACYGVETARYKNQNWQELMGTFVSAGTAAARFEHSRRNNYFKKYPDSQVNVGRLTAILSGSPPPSEMKWGRFSNLRRLLPLACDWARQGSAERSQNALTLLDWLKQEYPKEVRVRYERALTLAKLQRTEEALSELRELKRRFSDLDTDTLCLFGRCSKDIADKHFVNRQFEEAAECYENALEEYGEAYSLSKKNRFPGINVAALRLVLASVLVKHKTYGDPESPHPTRVEKLQEDCKALASELIASSLTWEKVLPDDTIWILATEAEARLLQEQWKHSAELYKTACVQPGVMPSHRESMRKQVKRIVEAFDRLGIEVGEPFDDLNEIFGPIADA